jgi:hypothetical protein
MAECLSATGERPQAWTQRSRVLPKGEGGRHIKLSFIGELAPAHFGIDGYPQIKAWCSASRLGQPTGPPY